MLRTMVSDGKSILPVETIEYEGSLWLVAEWIESPAEGWRKPLRIICLDNLELQPMPPQMKHLADYQLSRVIVPKAVFLGLSQKSGTTEFRVVEAPPIQFDIPKGVH